MICSPLIMARELAITLYLFIFKVLFKVGKWSPLQDKVTFVVSFSENNKSIYKEMMRQEYSCRTLFLTTEKMVETFRKFDHAETLLFSWKKPWDYLRSVYHLATSKIVFVDNYYGFLAKSDFKAGVECIQLWHANGAIKKFGLEDPSITSRGKRAERRFRDVYDRFTKVAVGSDVMGQIFSRAFGLGEERMLKTGVPRTDIFFNEEKKIRAVGKVRRLYPLLKGKKVILYAPTYREEGLSDAEMKLDLYKIAREFREDHKLLIKLHPAVRNQFSVPEELQDFVVDASAHRNMNELLFVADILITDYSSIPFEFALLEKPIIFFMYDRDAYIKERGMWNEFLDLIPGPVASTSDEVLEILKEYKFSKDHIAAFSKRWNEYSDGRSSYNIVEYIAKRLQG
jgi:teichoic acid glycerol-phosphate primase